MNISRVASSWDDAFVDFGWRDFEWRRTGEQLVDEVVLDVDFR